ncbi:MAG TPA: hypothetical protein PLU58_14005, partial [Saprospiraceae bacterium]|nr:hypothetical protein [Saprospiraceae bacterium]
MMKLAIRKIFAPAGWLLMASSMAAIKTNHYMKSMKITGLTTLLGLWIAQSLIAQVGRPFIHDPSTIAECDGKYYTFGTGGGGLISEDGWTWHGGGVRP